MLEMKLQNLFIYLRGHVSHIAATHCFKAE